MMKRLLTILLLLIPFVVNSQKTIVSACGAECGLAAANLHVSTNGGSFNTSTVKSGSRSFNINPSSSSQTASVNSQVFTNIHVWRVYVRYSSLPTSNCEVTVMARSPRNAGAYFNTADNKIYPGTSSGSTISFGSIGISVTTGIWYRLDVYINTSANPWTIDVSVDGTATAQTTFASGSSSSQDIYMGNPGASSSYNAFFDDLSVSVTSGDYPIGAGYVNHFVPASDGSHNISGSGDFDRGNTGTDILSSTTDSYLLIDEVPLPSGTVNEADCIRALAPASTEYTENIFGPASGISTPMVAPRYVYVAVVKHAIGTQTSNLTIRINDNGTTDNVFSSTGNNGTTYSYASKDYNNPPSGASVWTLSGDGNFNNLRIQFLTSDANPDVTFDAAIIEAEFEEQAPKPHRIKLITQNRFEDFKNNTK